TPSSGSEEMSFSQTSPQRGKIRYPQRTSSRSSSVTATPGSNAARPSQYGPLDVHSAESSQPGPSPAQLSTAGSSVRDRFSSAPRRYSPDPSCSRSSNISATKSAQPSLMAR